MISHYRQNIDHPIDNSRAWAILEDNYNKYYLNYEGDRTPVIPKNIHMIWLGKPFPDKYLRIRDTWLYKHPDWTFKIWDDKSASELKMVNRNAYDTVNNIAIKADILRYEILYKYGGLYVDIDFECIKPFDNLMYLDFIGGCGWNRYPSIFNALMACKPGDAFMRKVIQGISKKTFRNKYGVLDVLNIINISFITEIYMEHIKTTTDKTVIFPSSYFYPLPATARTDVRIDDGLSRKQIYSYIKPSSYCVHLWYTSWQ